MDTQQSINAEPTCCFNCGGDVSTCNFNNNDPNLPPYYHSYCSVCPVQWVLCGLCPTNNQPKFISCRTQKRHKKTISHLLKQQITQHTETFHPNLLLSSNVVSSEVTTFETLDCQVEESSFPGFDSNSGSNFPMEDESQVSATSFSSNTPNIDKTKLQQELLIAFPRNHQHHVKQKAYDDIREILFHKNYGKSYSEYLIKKIGCVVMQLMNLLC